MASTILQTESAIENQELLLWQGRFSARSMIGAWIGAGLVTALLVVGVLFIDAFRENRMVGWTLLFLLVGIWCSLLALTLYRKLGQHYEITSQRLKHRSGILLRQVNRIEMIDIDDVVYSNGPLQAILNVGTIRLLSSDVSHPNLVMHGISNVSHVANLIDDARRNERRIRGIHVEAI